MKIWKTLVSIMAISIFAGFACGRTGVEPQVDPTNEDAIYHIMIWDRPSEFNIDLLDFSVPDTSTLLAAPYVVEHFWRHLEHDSLDVDIRIVNPGPGDSLGSVPKGIVRMTKYFWGTLEVIAIDTTNGGSIPMRFSKRFLIRGDIHALFEKVGFDYNTRRGWILSRISHAFFTNYSRRIARIDFGPTSDPARFAAVDTNTMQMSAVPELSRGDSTVVSVHVASPDDYVIFRVPTSAGFVSRLLRPDSLGECITGFRLSTTPGYNHFVVDDIAGATLTGLANYDSYSIGVIYRAR